MNFIKILTLIVAVGVLCALIVSSPAQAYILRLDVFDTEVSKGDKVNLTAAIQLSPQDRLNITSIQLKLVGPLNTTCNFNVSGEIISGCNGITINKTSNCSLVKGYNGYGNCNSGYFGGREIELRYSITYDTNISPEGAYRPSLAVMSGNSVINSFSGERFKVVLPVFLKVIEPKNEDILDSRDVLINLSSSSKSLFYYSTPNNPEKWNKICSNFNLECSKKIKLDEGTNKIVFKAVDALGITSNLEEVEFIIDSIRPRIIKTYSNGTITNGNIFSVIYNKDDRLTGQEFMQNITLFYGADGYVKSVSRAEECLTGMNQNCTFEAVDVSAFEGDIIYYWFNVSTRTNSVLSNKVKIEIDTTAPQIEPLVNGVNQIISTKLYSDFKKLVYSRQVKFVLDIKEDNFDRVSYTDTNNCRNKVVPSQVLCTKLNAGRCISTKSFCVGSHNLTITAIDKAGNSDFIKTSFDILP